MEQDRSKFESVVREIEEAVKAGRGLEIDADGQKQTLYGVDLANFKDVLHYDDEVNIVRSIEARADNEDRPYAWTITMDHNAVEGSDGTDWGAIGVVGPGEPSDQQKAMLHRTAPVVDGYDRHSFKLYDNDQTLRYAGTAVMRAPTEEALEAPLRELGDPQITRINWEWHPERNDEIVVGQSELDAIRALYTAEAPNGGYRGETVEAPHQSAAQKDYMQRGGNLEMGTDWSL